MSRAKLIRQQIWEKLRPVAKPDSRFHLNFAEVIPDFEGSDLAIDRLVAQPAYREGRYAFVTPDNGLADLRRRMEVILDRGHRHDAAMSLLEMLPRLFRLHRLGFEHENAGDDGETVGDAVLHLFQQQFLLPHQFFHAPWCASR